MAELYHECGIAALYHLDGKPSQLAPGGDPTQISRLMPRVLLDLQNRGQLAAGMTAYNPNREQILSTFKQIGTVIEVFRLNRADKSGAILDEYSGRAVIGHVRYATCGANSRLYAQPFDRKHGCKWKWFSLAFNGQIANLAELKNELLSMSDYHLTTSSDTEILMHYIAHAHRGDRRPDLVEVFSELSRRIDGAYNLVYLNAMGDLVVLRDPLGIRPLCYARDGDFIAAASESVALLNLGFEDIRNVEPGEMLIVQDDRFRVERFAPRRPSAHCFFEWIYFANVASVLDGRSVYLSRSALGEQLARQERQLNCVKLDEDTIIVPVPDTGKAAADAMAFSLGVKSVEGLMRNRYVGRTFIEGENRSDRVRLKYTPLREVLAGKRVLLVEDTIVRSTTMKSLVNHIRESGGAREVQVRIACPPIIAPCFYGIDMSTVKELFAPRFMHGDRPTVAEQKTMARELSADSLFYLPLEAVAQAIGLHEDRLCRACITGHYPTSAGDRLYQLAIRNRHAEGNGRTYETPTEPMQIS